MGIKVKHTTDKINQDEKISLKNLSTTVRISWFTIDGIRQEIYEDVIKTLRNSSNLKLKQKYSKNILKTIYSNPWKLYTIFPYNRVIPYKGAFYIDKIIRVISGYSKFSTTQFEHYITHQMEYQETLSKLSMNQSIQQLVSVLINSLLERFEHFTLNNET